MNTVVYVVESTDCD